MPTEAPTGWIEETAHHFAAWLHALGPWAGLIFIVAYALGTTLLVPGSLFRFTAGAVFGMTWGFVLATCGALLGSAIAFLLARGVLRARVEAWLRARPMAAALTQDLSGKEGRRLVLMMRLSPIFPFSWTNYAMGLTDVRWIDYLVSTALGIMPATIVVVYLGAMSTEVAHMLLDPERATFMQWGVLILGVVATLAASWVMARRVRNALQERAPGVTHPAR